MTPSLLLVVEDSPAALTAARCTMELARLLHARVSAVGFAAGDAGDAGDAGEPDGPDGPDLAARTVLGHVARLARLEEVETDTVRVSGEIADCVLNVARRARPNLIVLGRADGALPPWAARIVERAEQPVIVVPGDWKPRNRREDPPA